MKTLHNKRIPWMIMCAIAFHIIWGLMLLIRPEVKSITGIATMEFISGTDTVEALMLIFFSLIALCSPVLGRIHWGLSLASVMPQQFLLWISLAGALIAAASGKYPDGYVPHGGCWFIFADQSPIIVISVFHTFAVIDHHILRRNI